MEQLFREKNKIVFASATSSNFEAVDSVDPHHLLLGLQKLTCFKHNNTFSSEISGIEESKEEEPQEEHKPHGDTVATILEREDQLQVLNPLRTLNNTASQPNFISSKDQDRYSRFYEGDVKKKMSESTTTGWVKKLRSSANVSEYTDENVLVYVNEPHRSKVCMIKEKVKMTALKYF